ncbi:MAG TPA: LysR family transcriptional regulator [Sedimentisphaerales bacterium]|nr:LysR family transcriptional regulator [Sedimentisphaerales bacterium]
MKRLKVRFKLWLNCSDAEGVFGDGKWRLLKAVEEKGSLRGASDTLGISYRKAWGDLNKAEQGLGIALVRKERGGSRGGRTGLTAAGRRWVAAYQRFRAEIENAAQKAYARHMKGLSR